MLSRSLLETVSGSGHAEVSLEPLAAVSQWWAMDREGENGRTGGISGQ